MSSSLLYLVNDINTLMISNEVRIDNFGSSNTYLDFPIYITKSDLGKGVIDSVLESIAENSIFYIPRGCTFRIDEFDMLEIKDSDSFVIAKLPMIDEDLYLYPRISMGRGVISQPQYDEDIGGLKPNSIPVDGEEGEIPEPVEDLHDVTFHVTYQNQPVTDAVITLGSVTNAIGEYAFTDMPSGVTNYTITTTIGDNVTGQIVVGMITKPVELEIANPVLTLPVETVNFENRSYQSQTFLVEGNVIWTATTQPDSFIKITQGSGQGNGMVVFNVLKNETINQRTGSITVSGGGLSVDYVITQASGEAFIRLSPLSMSYDPLIQTNKIVYVTSNVNWTASVVEGDGVTIVGDNTGEGNGSLSYSIPANDSAILKSYKIRFTGGGVSTDFNIQQGAKETILNISNTDLIYSASEHIDQEINVTSNTIWTALITEGTFFRLNTNAGTGNGVLKISLDLNDKTTDRTGVIKVSGGGITVLINIKQLKGGENIKVTPEFRNYTKDASFNQSITIESNTTWMAIADLGITIKSGGSGIGNGTLFFDISAGARDPRTLKITIKGIESEVTFSAIQEADPLAQGDGTRERPFLVYDIPTLKKVGSGIDGWGAFAFYEQVEDIDWHEAGEDFTPLNSVWGYDGKTHKITNLTISTSDYASMFKDPPNEVSNLIIDNATIDGVSGAAAIYIGKGNRSTNLQGDYSLDYYNDTDYWYNLYIENNGFNTEKEVSFFEIYPKLNGVQVLNSNITSVKSSGALLGTSMGTKNEIKNCVSHNNNITATLGLSSGLVVSPYPILTDVLINTSQSSNNNINGLESGPILVSYSRLNNGIISLSKCISIEDTIKGDIVYSIAKTTRVANSYLPDETANVLSGNTIIDRCISNSWLSGKIVYTANDQVSNSYVNKDKFGATSNHLDLMSDGYKYIGQASGNLIPQKITTLEMNTQSIFSGYDFKNTWIIDNNIGIRLKKFSELNVIQSPQPSNFMNTWTFALGEVIKNQILEFGISYTEVLIPIIEENLNDITLTPIKSSSVYYPSLKLDNGVRYIKYKLSTPFLPIEIQFGVNIFDYNLYGIPFYLSPAIMIS